VADSIKNALLVARNKLSELINSRTEIDKEIIHWKRVVDSLSAVTEESSDELPEDVNLMESLAPLTTVKFTDAVRFLLQSAKGSPISAPQIRDVLTKLGFNLSKYKQELVPIHNTLKRLQEQGEARPVKNEQGQTIGYGWIDPVQRALTDTSAWSAAAAGKLSQDISNALEAAGLPNDHASKAKPSGRRSVEFKVVYAPEKK
jgi:hypothetical protein